MRTLNRRLMDKISYMTLEVKNCLDCGYILDGLSINRCPECGRTFNIGNNKTYALNNPRGRPLRSGVGYLSVACIGLIVIIWFISASEPMESFYRPDWVQKKRLVWKLAQSAELGVLFVGAIQSRRNRYSWMHRLGMWIAGFSLLGFWFFFFVLGIFSH